MDDEQQEPTPDELEESGEVDSRELDDEDLDQAAGGDPGHTHPDIPDVWPGG